MSTDLPEVLTRFRSAFDEAFFEFCHRYPGQVGKMFSYHMGWLDEKSNESGSTRTLGKAIRPSLLLLSAEASGGDWKRVLAAAIAVEILHNASLIHDDIQDKDDIRHHRPTVRSLYSDAQAINAGDWGLTVKDLAILALFDKGFSADKVVDAQRTLSQATLDLLEGQWMDLDFERRPMVSIGDYKAMIARKTGKLIEISVLLGSKLGGADPQTIYHLHRYAKSMGLLFQIVDDLLNIWGDITNTGKAEQGADIKRRKRTYPIVYAFEHASQSERTTLERIWSAQETVTNKQVDLVMGILDRVGAYQQTHTLVLESFYAAESAIKQAQIATRYKQDFLSIAEFFVQRKF